MQDLIFLSAIAIKSSIAVMIAAIGEIITERSGVLNLGVEGMMLVGALAGFAIGFATKNPWLAVCGAMLAGGLLSLIHAFFAITLRANQTLSGLALAILGTGLANFLGRPLIGKRGIRFGMELIPGLSDIPVIGPIFFRQSALVYAAYILVPLAMFLLFRTRAGLTIRAVGEDAVSADAAGVNVTLVRYACTFLGGLLAGLGGCYLSLAYTPGWKENMTGGQGWIAIAIVIFAAWRPSRALVGSLLFGGLTALQFLFQATGIEVIPVYVLKMLPYLLTIAVLVFVTRPEKSRGAPASLGIPFSREN